jgi:hypothetical protein
MNKDYIILEADNSAELQAQVSEFLESGWQPLGGVSVSNGLLGFNRFFCASFNKRKQ